MDESNSEKAAREIKLRKDGQLEMLGFVLGVLGGTNPELLDATKTECEGIRERILDLVQKAKLK